MHDVVAQAAEGVLPTWAVVNESRREHIRRVSALLAEWAERLELAQEEGARWRAVGALHDALRDQDPETLRERVPPSLQDLPTSVLHGPAAAERLRIEGVEDGELLNAVAFHTLGDPSFRALGRALYAADFLEPGRTFAPALREELRARMPAALDEVVLEIVRARIGHLMERRVPLRPRTVDFWNRLVEERA